MNNNNIKKNQNELLSDTCDSSNVCITISSTLNYNKFNNIIHKGYPDDCSLFYMKKM